MSPEQELGRILREKRLTIAIAESVTGGLVGDIVTNVPGSSRYFEGAITTYSDGSKIKLLKVKEATLRCYGAVSEECAREMAEGVREAFGASIGISVTGIAGPTGATFGKPVGLVCFAYCNGPVCITEKKTFSGGRMDIKRAAAEHLISFALEALKED
ncbi:MAG: CinA family protein [Methanomassiliicoccales archaeon]|nr:MAG: CinA family protein [Methanomassiliicoccales archaeon]